MWHFVSYSSTYLIFLMVLQWLTQSEQSSVSTGDARVAAAEKQRMRARDLMTMDGGVLEASEFIDTVVGPFYRGTHNF